MNPDVLAALQAQAEQLTRIEAKLDALLDGDEPEADEVMRDLDGNPAR